MRISTRPITGHGLRGGNNVQLNVTLQNHVLKVLIQNNPDILGLFLYTFCGKYPHTGKHLCCCYCKQTYAGTFFNM